MKRKTGRTWRRQLQILRRYAPWLYCLFGMDGFLILMLWLTNQEALAAVSGFLILGTLFLFLMVSSVLFWREQQKNQVFREFLEDQDEVRSQRFLQETDPSRRDLAEELIRFLQEKELERIELVSLWNDYEEYVELWTHEVKTPLSLLTLVLDNHRDEIPETLVCKLDYVRNRMQESVDQMLFYARLNGSRKDYLFESVCLKECMQEVLEDYQPLLSEKAFEIQNDLEEEGVYTDRRGIRFLLGQLVSNSIKYAGENPTLKICAISNPKQTILEFCDNGQGVRKCDLPYIFEKGFTGDSCENRKKATGMGLYLVKKLAGDLNLSLETESAWQEGFCIRVGFPVVEGTRCFHAKNAYQIPVEVTKES